MQVMLLDDAGVRCVFDNTTAIEIVLAPQGGPATATVLATLGDSVRTGARELFRSVRPVRACARQPQVADSGVAALNSVKLPEEALGSLWALRVRGARSLSSA
jgi:hypothetical protein